MNYLEIAEAYDKQADFLLTMIQTQGLTELSSAQAMSEVLTLRGRAASCRAEYRSIERAEERHKAQLEADSFDREFRTKWLAAAERSSEALEAIAKNMPRIDPLAALMGRG